MNAVIPEDNELPSNVRSKLASSPPKTPARVKIILEEHDDIPPTGLFIQCNGRSYMLRPGVVVSVPQEIVSVLNDAVTMVPTIDPLERRVIGYRSRTRFPYRLA